MYATDKHVFIHMNKTGGVFVKDWMIKHLGATMHRYKHAPIRMMKKRHRDKIKIGCIRHPFDWYVSFYAYLNNNTGFDMGFNNFINTYTRHSRALLSLGGKGIRKKFENVYPPKANKNIVMGAYTFFFINYFSNHARNIFINWTTNDLENNTDIFEKDIDCLMRVESLREDMIEAFGEEHRESIEDFPSKNVSTKKPILTDKHKETIESRDGILMEYLGYEFKS